MKKSQFNKKCIAKISDFIEIEDQGMLCCLRVSLPRDDGSMEVPLDLGDAERILLALDEWINT